MTEVSSIHAVATRLRRMARPPYCDTTVAPSQATAAPAAKPQSKSGLIIQLLARPAGATLDQLVSATGWLPHTARAAMTGLKRKGHALTSEKTEGGPRIYRVVTNAVQIPIAIDDAGAAEPAA